MDETGCGRCHEEGGCGGNNIGKMFCTTPRTFRVLNPGHSDIGDHVNIVITEGVVRRSAVLAYGLPLLALILGALAGSKLAGEIGAIVGSFSALLCSWLALHFAQLKVRPDQRTQPYIRY
jgi:sigma-E factor negative regulatory protein RseC